MGRWEPDAHGRLSAAALDLYLGRGFEQTTVADIANRAGLTARTFFRYFTDKREVLFGGSAALAERITAAVDGAPPDAAALDVVAAALDAAAELLGGHRDFSRRRQAVIVANSELMERELVKLASLATLLAEGLRRRGVADPDASLAAETGIAVLRVAFDRWTGTADPDASLAELMRTSLDQLRALAAGAAVTR